MTWESTTTLSRRLDVDERTVRRWAARGLVVAELLPGGHYRIRCGANGFPLRVSAPAQQAA